MDKNQDHQTQTPSSTLAAAQVNYRKKCFKNIGRDPEELRKKRIEAAAELRKTAKLDQLAKRRNLIEEHLLKESLDVPETRPNVQFDNLLDHSTIRKIVIDILGDDFEAQCAATFYVRRILCSDQIPSFSELLVMSGASQKFIEFLRLIDRPDLQFEAAWILTNILSGNSEETENLVKLGIIELLIQLLSSPAIEVIHQALWALGNIAGDSKNYRDTLVEHGILPQLILIVSSQSDLRLLRRIAWIISNMSRIKNPSPSMDIVRQFISLLARLMRLEDVETLIDAIWALSYLTDGANERIDELLNLEILPRVVHLLESSNGDLVFPCVRLIGNVATGTNDQIQKIISANAMVSLIKLLLCDRMSIVKEVSWALSNVAAGSESQIQTLIDGEAIPNVFHVLKNGDSQAKSEALWIVTNIAAIGNPVQIYYMCEKGVVECLCEFLNPIQDPLTLISAIDSLNNIIMILDWELRSLIKATEYVV